MVKVSLMREAGHQVRRSVHRPVVLKNLAQWIIGEPGLDRASSGADPEQADRAIGLESRDTVAGIVGELARQVLVQEKHCELGSPQAPH